MVRIRKRDQKPISVSGKYEIRKAIPKEITMNILTFFRKSILRQQMANYLAIAIIPSVMLTWIISSMANYFIEQNVQRNLFVLADAKSAGKVRMEGKDYVMHDGDVVEFRFNV